ncbi:MAG: preprotein translocase subunit SecE [Deltaproteobacteria bacterium]|nr:preprotein translocase subunit SecE [Deltaproteobacteria bacterium]
MGRLKKKRPASTKKKGRKKAVKENNLQRGPEKPLVSDLTYQKKAEPKELVKGKKEVPKTITPSGRGIQLAFWGKATQFLREVRIELRKVTWPSKKDAMASTAVVIVLVFIVSAFLGLVDVGLSSLIRLVLQ